MAHLLWKHRSFDIVCPCIYISTLISLFNVNGNNMVNIAEVSLWKLFAGVRIGGTDTAVITFPRHDHDDTLNKITAQLLPVSIVHLLVWYTTSCNEMWCLLINSTHYTRVVFMRFTYVDVIHK